MVKIVISESAETVNDMAFTLRHIADLIEKGNTSGYSPTWAIKGDEEPKDEKQVKIDRIKDILVRWGCTDACELELESSPVLASIGNGRNNVSQLVEEFYIDTVRVVTYHDDSETGDNLIPYRDLPDDTLNEVLVIIEGYETKMREQDNAFGDS